MSVGIIDVQGYKFRVLNLGVIEDTTTASIRAAVLKELNVPEILSSFGGSIVNQNGVITSVYEYTNNYNLFTYSSSFATTSYSYYYGNRNTYPVVYTRGGLYYNRITSRNELAAESFSISFSSTKVLSYPSSDGFCIYYDKNTQAYSRYREAIICFFKVNNNYGYAMVILGLTPELSKTGYLDNNVRNFSVSGSDVLEVDVRSNIVNDDETVLPIPKDIVPPITTGLYYNKSERNKISKELDLISEYEMVFKHPISILDPVIDIKTDDIENIVKNANYMYIDQLGRYYYITDIEIVRKGLIRITGHVDVLMSYAKQIKDQNAIIARNSEKYNLYLADDRFLFQANPIIKTKIFPKSPFTNAEGNLVPHYVLAVSGRIKGSS